MIPTKRFPLRNCIRPDTYRYHMDMKNFELAWNKLVAYFGKPRRFGSLDLYEINASSFLLRVSLGTASITVIKKRELKGLDLDKFHEIIKFNKGMGLKNVS